MDGAKKNIVEGVEALRPRRCDVDALMKFDGNGPCNVVEVKGMVGELDGGNIEEDWCSGSPMATMNVIVPDGRPRWVPAGASEMS